MVKKVNSTWVGLGSSTEVGLGKGPCFSWSGWKTCRTQGKGSMDAWIGCEMHMMLHGNRSA